MPISIFYDSFKGLEKFDVMKIGKIMKVYYNRFCHNCKDKFL